VFFKPRICYRFPMHALPGDLTTRLIDDLVRSNYGVVENAVEPTLVAALRECAAEHRFRPAGVGKAGINDPSIRNDEISWIDEKDLRPAEQRLFEFLEALRQRLNEELFLGLEDFEAHFASYESGHFYSRHVDRFADESARTISIVVYLNETWT
jgi:SM-20-related protein